MFPARNDKQETITPVYTWSSVLQKEKQDKFLKCVLYIFYRRGLFSLKLFSPNYLNRKWNCRKMAEVEDDTLGGFSQASTLLCYYKLPTLTISMYFKEM